MPIEYSPEISRSQIIRVMLVNETGDIPSIYDVCKYRGPFCCKCPDNLGMVALFTKAYWFLVIYDTKTRHHYQAHFATYPEYLEDFLYGQVPNQTKISNALSVERCSEENKDRAKILFNSNGMYVAGYTM
jgi:hypothetical protein